MFVHHRTRGIFLSQEDRGEADRLFSVFTDDFGKIDVLGRAIRKISSKLRAGTDDFYLSEIEFIQGKNYKTLTDAIVLEKFKNVRNNPEKLAIAYKIISALDYLVGYEEQDQKIWFLLLNTLKNIENLKIENSLKIDNCKLKISFYFFFWSLLKILGYYPELYFCPICSKKLLPEMFYFFPREGGVVCWQCFKGFEKEEKKEAKEIRVNVVKVLRILTQKPLNVFKKIKLDKKEEKNLEEITELYFNFLKNELSKREK